MKKLSVCLLFVLLIVSLTGCVRSNTSNRLNTSDTPKSSDSAVKPTATIIDATPKLYGTVLTKPDIVVGNKMFATQMTDWQLNWGQYEGKTVEIEGLYIASKLYTFIGRYSSIPCGTCPQGYSYMEFRFDGADFSGLVSEKNWLKITGTLTTGYDDPKDVKTAFYYIKASSVEVKAEWGQANVSN